MVDLDYIDILNNILNEKTTVPTYYKVIFSGF